MPCALPVHIMRMGQWATCRTDHAAHAKAHVRAGIADRPDGPWTVQGMVPRTTLTDHGPFGGPTKYVVHAKAHAGTATRTTPGPWTGPDDGVPVHRATVQGPYGQVGGRTRFMRSMAREPTAIGPVSPNAHGAEPCASRGAPGTGAASPTVDEQAPDRGRLPVRQEPAPAGGAMPGLRAAAGPEQTTAQQTHTRNKTRHENQHPDRRKSTTQKPETTKTEPRTHTASHKVRRHQKTQEKAHPDAISEGDGLLAPTASRRPPIGGTATFLMVFAVQASDIGVRRYRRDGRRGPGGGAMNDGNMIQEPPACPVCGLAVEERDPRRGKPLSIHRACRNRRREELRKERERGRRMSQESLLMASRNDVAEAAAELRRRVAWRNEAVGPADHGTVELCYWSVRCMAALMRLEPETLMAYEDRWAVDLARSIGRKGMDRIAGLTGWRGPRPWTMDPAMTDTGEDHTLEGMWPEPGPGVDDEWRADLDHDDGAGPRAVGMDRIIEGIWAEDHRGRNGADHGWWSLDEGARP